MDNMPSLDNLSQEQIDKLKVATSAEELLEIAAEEEIEFTSEQLAAISGGSDEYWEAFSYGASATTYAV